MASPPQLSRRFPVLWVLFGFSGRISRGVYWLAMLFFVAVLSVVLAQVAGQEEARFFDAALAIWPVVVLLTAASNVAVSVKRLHDCGYSGFLVLALLIPFVGLAFPIWVGMVPGTAGPNRFGSAPDVPPR